MLSLMPRPPNLLHSSCAGGHLSEVGLVHNEMRFEAYRGDFLTKFAVHTHILAYVRSFLLWHRPV